ncbi:MAG: alpha/beta hydrolase [Verrucomicrobia bacterium]|nr:alpha/beta hydrolase [Verrucomicrobiota bacterium]
MPTRTRPRNYWRTIGGLVLIPAACYLWLRWFEYRQVYHPSARWWADGSALGQPWEDVPFAAADGLALSGWFFPAAADSPRRHWAVLVCHGNGGNISHRLELYRVLLETGVAVFAFDYRGYGRSAGRPSEQGTYADAEGALAWLAARGFDTRRVIAFGESLGGGVAAELAARQPLGALILQSTFTSVPDLGAELFPFLPVRTLSRIGYDTRAKLPRLALPVLVMHSRSDTLVPYAHAERNFAAAREPKLFWELAGDHNEPLAADRAKFLAGLERFWQMLRE